MHKKHIWGSFIDLQYYSGRVSSKQKADKNIQLHRLNSYPNKTSQALSFQLRLETARKLHIIFLQLRYYLKKMRCTRGIGNIDDREIAKLLLSLQKNTI